MSTRLLARFIPALAGVLAVVGLDLFLAVALLLQYLRSDLDWITAPLSFYLIGPHGGWLVAAYFALALSLLAVGWGLHADLLPAVRSRLALLLFATAAACVCIVALAHTDLPGAGRLTPMGTLHNAAATLAFVTASFAMLLQAWRLRHDPRWRAQHPKAFVLAVLIFAALLAYALFPWLPRGITQKFVILLIVLWLLMSARWLTLTWKRGAAT